MIQKFILLPLISTIILFSGCAPRDNYLKKLAQEGRINEKAPLVNSASIEVEVSPEKVWDLIINVKKWPSWNSKIIAVQTNGILFDGDTFGMVLGKKVYSTVLVFEENRKIVWFSTSMAYRGVMKWDIEATGKDKTRVTVTESRDGFFMNFMSGKKHQALLADWLMSLKNRAEVVIM